MKIFYQYNSNHRKNMNIITIIYVSLIVLTAMVVFNEHQLSSKIEIITSLYTKAIIKNNEITKRRIEERMNLLIETASLPEQHGAEYSDLIKELVNRDKALWLICYMSTFMSKVIYGTSSIYDIFDLHGSPGIIEDIEGIRNGSGILNKVACIVDSTNSTIKTAYYLKEIYPKELKELDDLKRRRDVYLKDMDNMRDELLDSLTGDKNGKPESFSFQHEYMIVWKTIAFINQHIICMDAIKNNEIPSKKLLIDELLPPASLVSIMEEAVKINSNHNDL